MTTYAEYLERSKKAKPSIHLVSKETQLPSKLRARKQRMQIPPLDIAPRKKVAVK